MIVSSICLSSLYDGSDIYFYKVGKSGVTKIKELVYSPDPFCTKFYYEVWTNEILFRKLYQVTCVTYEEN